MSIAPDTTVDMSLMVTRAIHSITSGIAPHQGRALSEEYAGNVPVFLRNRGGLPGDELAAILATDRPELGIESENDLYQMLADGATQRTNAEYYREEINTVSTTTTTTGFDAVEAAQAVQEFEFTLSVIDPQVLEQVRQAWQAAYLKCGHKALARTLLGNTDKALKGIEKRASKLALN